MESQQNPTMLVADDLTLTDYHSRFRPSHPWPAYPALGAKRRVVWHQDIGVTIGRLDIARVP